MQAKVQQANGQWMEFSIFQRGFRPTVCRDSICFYFQLAKKMKIPGKHLMDYQFW